MDMRCMLARPGPVSELPVPTLGIAMGRGIMAACAGLVAGTALQLQQPGLWEAWAYAALAWMGVALAVARPGRQWPHLLWFRHLSVFVAAGLLAFGLTGLR